jgi:hypothetical protein
VEALIALVALVSLGLLAMRFGVDSRPALRSDEHRLALTGMEWDASTAPGESAAVTPPNRVPDDPPIRLLIWSPALTARSGSTSTPFPVLQAIDRAREPGQPAFTTDPNAELLEQRARQLADQHWNEFTWLTGRIEQSRFDLVCEALERDRRALQRAGKAIDVIVVSEHQSSIAS